MSGSGPRIPVYSAGAKAVGVYGMMCLVDGVTLGHIVQSYMDEITLSYTACRNAMPDPDFYSECVQASFDDHMAALKIFQKKEAEKATEKTYAKKSEIKKPTASRAKPVNGGARQSRK